MSTTFGGILYCDVCGDPILWLTDGDRAYKFQDPKIRTDKGNIVELHCHQDPCKRQIEEASRKKDWRALPPGPLKDKYHEAVMASHYKTLVEKEKDKPTIIARDEIVPIEAD